MVLSAPPKRGSSSIAPRDRPRPNFPSDIAENRAPDIAESTVTDIADFFKIRVTDIADFAEIRVSRRPRLAPKYAILSLGKAEKRTPDPNPNPNFSTCP